MHPFQGAHRWFPHGLAHLHPSPYSTLIWGARGSQPQGPHEAGRGAGVQTACGVGPARRQQMQKGQPGSPPPPTPNQPHGQSPGRTFLAIPRGELVWEVLLGNETKVRHTWRWG